MKSKFLILAVAAMGIQAVAAELPTVVSGRVFHDANANGRFDQGESPLADVKLTDGVSIVKTGADGAYEIQLKPDHMLTVPGTQVVALCWPSGKWPTSKHWFRVKDIKDPGKCDFGLRDDAQKVPFTYLHVSDNHDWRASQYENQHENATTTWRDASFIINTGDVAFGGATPEGMEQSAARLHKCMSLNPMPTLITIGNHDTDSNYGSDHEYSFCGGFAKMLGPLRWSFDYAGVHFAFIDVLDDNPKQVDPTAEWLDKDLSLLPKGTRIILSYHYPTPGSSRKLMEVMAKHRIELMQAGHNHAYKRYRGVMPAPMVTAFARSSGAANIMHVGDDSVQIGVFCDGCARGAHNYNHSRRCPVNWRTHFIEAHLDGRTTKVHEVGEKSLDGAESPVSVEPGAVYVTAHLMPGKQGSCGLRIHKQGGGEIDVTYENGHLTIAGSRFPTRIPPNDNGMLRLYVFAHKGMLTVWANDVFFCEQEVDFKGAVSAGVMAKGGPAKLAMMKIQEIKPDPENKDAGIYCNCGHGGIMSNP